MSGCPWVAVNDLGSPSDRARSGHAWLSTTGSAPGVEGSVRAAPSLLCCLAGDAEAARDLGSGVPGAPEPGDGLADRLVQLGGEPGHVGQGVGVPGRDAPGVGVDDAAEERGVLV